MNCGNCEHYRMTHGGPFCFAGPRPKAVSPLSSCDSFTPKQEDMENKTATKTCPRCGRTLPVENFGRHSKTKDGYQPICQDCRKEAMKKGREKIRQARLKYGEEKAVGFSLKPNGYLEYTRGKNKSRSVHVVLMEEHIGRRLLPGEVVHHINGDKTDNRIENLMLMTKAEHTRLHARLKHLKQTK